MSDKSTVVKKDGKEFRFSFNPQTDWPEEGVTLTGVFEGSKRLRPSAFTDDQIPYDEANKRLIK